MRLTVRHAASVDQGPTASRAEIIAAFSYALDLTEGQPAGHCIRACWIGMQIGREFGLPPADLADLYYTLLLKDLGCSSNAARICELYEADDRAFKQGYKTVGTSLAATLHFIFRKTAQGRPFRARAATIGKILRNGDAIAQELIVSRCTRGAHCPDAAILRGRVRRNLSPRRALGRVGSPGPAARCRHPAVRAHCPGGAGGRGLSCSCRGGGRARRGRAAQRPWFDPTLVQALKAASASPRFWAALASPTIESRVVALAPRESELTVDDAYLDAITDAFGQVIDAKSPFTAGHSQRVGDLAASMAEAFGMSAERVRWLRRAAVLHDVGKLGVSSAILEKPAGLDDREWVEMRGHAAHTRVILGKIGAFADLADVAAAHHERPDGAGYPLAISGDAISRETRIITACDFFDALVSDRPYRGALPVEQAIAIMSGEVGKAIDAECLGVLKAKVA